ncbi:Hypothetical predicted protein [Mytilus galloprovincialis]|uniref:Uncharacterized protein n=1 Tax=Mytilus galloprovincialis TaxID=29158 RepID=A0A8B6G5Z2_MYTGA|nr:Hypothetical predicted protein [Mytilus galloprovincialis]
MSQFPLLGTVANFTLTKRQEILDKSTVSEALQQRLLAQAVPLSRSMGSDNFRQVGTFDFTEGIGTSVSGTASSFSCSNQSVSDKGFSKESVVTRRSEHSYSEGCDGGGKSSFSARV